MKRFVFYSPAEAAGIQAGDVIMSINGNKVDALSDLNAIISKFQANDIVEIELARAIGGEINCMTVSATLTHKGNFDLD